VDAGALGLVVIVRGAIEGLVGSGDALPEIPHYEAARIERAHQQGSKYRYCTNFVVQAPGLVARDWIGKLERIGDSVLAVADRTALKVHVHTDDPDAAMAIFDGVGPVEMQEQMDMREQIAARASAGAGSATVPASRTGAVAVVAGDGIAAMLAAEGVMTVDGGATLNPSTEEILAAIESHPAREVLVLPNSKNVVLAAERAAELASKETVVVGCLSQQAAVMLAVELDADAAAARNADRLERVLGEIRTGAVAPAARDDAEGRFAEGDVVGFVGEEPVAWGDAGSALREVAARLAEGSEVLAILTGDGAPPLDEDIGLVPAGIEVEIRDGGQPAYWWLLAAQ
jgi:dihydroxyacetone kinase-like predicted kinase